MGEELVIKLNDVRGTAEVVGLGLAWLDRRLIDVAHEVFTHALAEDRGVGVAKAVNRLLGVTDEHVEIAIGQALLEQAAEVLILLGARVLELVDHEVGNG